MKGLKSFFSLAVAAVFCFCMAGCWDGGDSGSNMGPAGTESAPISSTLPEVEPWQATGGFRTRIDFNQSSEENVVSRGKINNNTEYMLMPFLRVRTDIVKIFLYSKYHQWWREYGCITFPVVNGICDLEIKGILPGDYMANIFAVGQFGNHLKSDDIFVTIEANLYPEVSIYLELNYFLEIPVRIIPPTGEFHSGNWYECKVDSSKGFGGNPRSQYIEEEGFRFIILAFPSFSNKQVRISIADDRGIPQVYNCPFEILDIINLDVGEFMELLPSIPKTGGLTIEASFEDEEVFKLSRSSEIFDGTPENPTGHAGDPNCLVGSFILQVDNDEVVKGGNFEIFCDAFSQYFNEATFNMTKMGGEYDAIWSYTIGGDIIQASMPLYIELEPGYYQLKAHADVKAGVETSAAFTIGVVCHMRGVDTGIYYSTKIVESQKIFIALVVEDPITLHKDNFFPDGSENASTGVAGETAVNIGSFVANFATDCENVKIVTYTDEYPLGRCLQNLSLFIDGEFVETISALSIEYEHIKYAFSTIQSIKKGIRQVRLFADVKMITAPVMFNMMLRVAGTATGELFETPFVEGQNVCLIPQSTGPDIWGP